MIRKTLVTSLSLFGLGALCSLNAQAVFQDDFSGPDFQPGWVQYNNPGNIAQTDTPGSWQLETHATYGPIVRPYLGDNPPPSGYTLDKILSYEGFTLGDSFSMSADMVGFQQRWAGVAFNIQGGDPEVDWNQISYYSLIVSVHNTNSAIQIRRFDNGSETVFNAFTVVPDPHTGPHQFLRFSVSSDEPGVYLLSVDRIHNDTREFVSNAGSFTFTDPGTPLTGGFAGLHSNSNEMGYTHFEVIPEPATVGIILAAAALGLVLARRRFRR